MLIEQAIFTSAQTHLSAGYQLAGRSPGVCEADAREISVWCPSHDSLLESGPDAVSVNFHALPSGAYCVSRTTPAGAEYSGRRGQQVYTQCLIVPDALLARFANNPFSLLTAAFAQGTLRVYERVPAELEPIRMTGRASAVDQALLPQLINDLGVTWLGAILEAVLRGSPAALVAGPLRPRLVNGLINCLPVECRPALSFSTGLKFSPRRPFRLVCLTGDPAEQRRLLRPYDVSILALSERPPRELLASTGWSGFVTCAIAAGKTSFLAAQLAVARDGLTERQLPALGDELLECLAVEADQPVASEAADLGHERTLAEAAHCFAENRVASAIAMESAAEPRQQARMVVPAAGEPPVPSRAEPTPDPTSADHATDAAAVRPRQARPPANRDRTVDAAGPSYLLGKHRPEVVERLETLDDAVFEAIAGKPGALDQLKRLWPDVLGELGGALVAESREHYIRHALNMWQECVQGEEVRNPALAVAVMNVLTLLLSQE